LFDDPETQCRQVLASFAPVMARIPRTAWKRFLAFPDSDRFALSKLPIQRANVINALMHDEAQLNLVPLDGVKVIPNVNTPGYLVSDEVFVRFKALDQDGLSRNYPTQRSLAFNANESLEGIPATALRVDCGYQLNELQTEIKAVLVVHRSGAHAAWSFSIDAPADVIVLPIQRPLDEGLEEIPAIRGRGEHAKIKTLKLQATDDE
jgi:hypothetical protein